MNSATCPWERIRTAPARRALPKPPGRFGGARLDREAVDGAPDSANRGIFESNNSRPAAGGGPRSREVI